MSPAGVKLYQALCQTPLHPPPGSPGSAVASERSTKAENGRGPIAVALANASLPGGEASAEPGRANPRITAPTMSSLRMCAPFVVSALTMGDDAHAALTRRSSGDGARIGAVLAQPVRGPAAATASPASAANFSKFATNMAASSRAFTS